MEYYVPLSLSLCFPLSSYTRLIAAAVVVIVVLSLPSPFFPVGLGSILLSPNPIIIGTFESSPEFSVEETITKKMAKDWSETTVKENKTN